MAKVEVAFNVAGCPVFHNRKVSLLDILEHCCLGRKEGTELFPRKIEVLHCFGIQLVSPKLMQACARVFNGLRKRADLFALRSHPVDPVNHPDVVVVVVDIEAVV